MKTKILITVIVLGVILVGGAVYFFWSPAGNTPGDAVSGTGTEGTQAGGQSPPAVIPLPKTPVPASSYGQGAEGQAGTASDNLMIPKAGDAVGILQGQAKLTAGAKLDLSSVKVSVSDPKTKEVLKTESVGANGGYSFTVLPGEYVLDVVAGTATTSQLPQRIYVGPNQTLNVNFFVR